MNILKYNQVAVFNLREPVYPEFPPFNPSERYPEYHGELSISGPNLVYEAVRQCFGLLGLDREHYDTPEWNPLSNLIKPGDRVILKPNFLSQSHGLKTDEWKQVITHGSIIRVIIDYVIIAMKQRGELTIIDGPQYDANWNQILERTGTEEVVRYCRAKYHVPIKLIDLRDYQQLVLGGVIYRRFPLTSDPLGSVEVDLGDLSAFLGHKGAGRYYGSDYNQAETNQHHVGGRHEYRISRTATSADVFINLPKLKTHKKVGVTLSLKNLVGINVGRNWLPHHTDGDPSNSGDQFPSASVKSQVERSMVRWLKQRSLNQPRFSALFRFCKNVSKSFFGETDQVIRHGNWYRNDTAWRMVLDINRSFLYSGVGIFPSPRPKRYFSLVDGVIGGNGNGPDCPDSFFSSVLIAGHNPVAVDCTATSLMGFDPMKIAKLKNAFLPHILPLVEFPYESIQVISNFPSWNDQLVNIPQNTFFKFTPHFGWIGQVEFDK